MATKRTHRHPTKRVNPGVIVVDGTEVLDQPGTRGLELERVLEWIEDGMSVSEVARQLGVTQRAVWDWAERDPKRLARMRESLQRSSHAYADKAREVIANAPANPVEIARARELAHHYRWMAKVLAPKIYGDKVEVEHRGVSLAEGLRQLASS